MGSLPLIEDYLANQENGMKELTAWSLNQAMLQEAPRRQELLRTFPSVSRKCNAMSPRKTLLGCLMNDILKSSVCGVRPGCGNALNTEILNQMAFQIQAALHRVDAVW